MHLQWNVKFFPAFGFDNENPLGGQLDQKIRVVVGDVTVHVHVIQFEAYRQIILGVGNNVAAIFQETGKQQFKVTVPDNSVKDALFRNKVALIFGYEGPCLPQLDGVPDFGVALVLHGEAR